MFIYNKRLIPAAEVPTTHGALAKLIASQPDKFKNKVTTYDIEKSAVGFMLAVQDKANDPSTSTRLGHRQGRPDRAVVHRHHDGTRVLGENPIGYNIPSRTPRPAPRTIRRWASPT